MISTAHAGWWKRFCENYLIGPDQYELYDATVDVLVTMMGRGSSAAYNQARLLMLYDELSPDDLEVLSKAIVRYEYKH